MRPNFQKPIDREKVETEARAKIIWGDGSREVLGFLLVNGYSRDEAFELIEVLQEERRASVRGIGIRKIISGAAMTTVPVIAWLIMIRIGIIYYYILTAAVMAGLIGAYRLTQGVVMAFFPKADSSDLATHSD